MKQHKPWASWLLAAALTLGAATAWAQDLVSALREEIVPVAKAGLFTITLQSTYFRPPGEGPFPRVIINHGKSPGDPRFQPRYRPLYVARELVQRGDAVAVPMRQSHGGLTTLAASPPRAFALGPTGAWSWRSGVADAMAQVIERCSKSSKAGPCKLYAVDGRVVWTRE